jgi:D-alanine-D-alanine ligase
MDKIMMKQFFRGADLPVLPGIGVTRTRYLSEPKSVFEEVEKELGYPVFVKPANLGSSIGVSRADDRESLEDSLELAFEYDRRVLIEAGLDKPIELNCSVLGYDEEIEASPIEMPINQDEFLDFKDKYLASGGSKGMASVARKIPADLSLEKREEVRDLAVRSFKALGCNGVARIDFMIDEETGKLYFNEINTIPGSLAFYLWEPIGVPYKELLDKMIQYARKRVRTEAGLTFTFDTNILANANLGGGKGGKN